MAPTKRWQMSSKYLAPEGFGLDEKALKDFLYGKTDDMPDLSEGCDEVPMPALIMDKIIILGDV
jgi:hypothetical protein